jgi:hypothetical protein
MSLASFSRFSAKLAPILLAPRIIIFIVDP